MYRLRKQFKFEAAHQLVGHDGKCARLHGHSWVGWVEMQGELLMAPGPKEGMLVDFYDLGAMLKPLVENYLDHHFLNETLDMTRPTSERVARWVYDKLHSEWLHPAGKERNPLSYEIRVAAVTIEETCTSSAEYRP